MVCVGGILLRSSRLVAKGNTRRRDSLHARTCRSAVRHITVCLAVRNSNEKSSSQGQTIVVAFGGNALLRRGQELTFENQRRNAAVAAKEVAKLMKRYNTCITHGNGPQVGLLATLMGPEARLDVLDAETEGSIGYVLELQISNAIGCSRNMVSMLTQVTVDGDDPAFDNPTKPIGRQYLEEELAKLDQSWRFAKDGPTYYRRVVASPMPMGIVEGPSIRMLLENNVTVICCGGGGIPVVERMNEDGKLERQGIEAVVDKDASSSVLGVEIGASKLLMLTDAECVYDPVAWPDELRPLPSPISVGRLKGMEFAPGSMMPKIKAAIHFVEETGGVAGIGNMSDAVDILAGNKGTLIVQP